MFTFFKNVRTTDAPHHTLADQVDLCFVVDTTGSMGTFIQAAQRTLLDVIKRLSAPGKVSLQVGLVEYRDYPPQDRSFVTRVYPMTDDLTYMQKVVNRLRARGGGDAPEAVYRGIYEALIQMKWRAHSSRYLMLVGDAPPHGFSAWYQAVGPADNRRLPRHGDAWPDGCPSGLDVFSVTAAAEEKRVVLYALCMGRHVLTRVAFTALATATGGQCTTTDNAEEVLDAIEKVLQEAYAHLAFDRRVLDLVAQSDSLDARALASTLACSEEKVAASMGRLGRRGLVQAAGLVPA